MKICIVVGNRPQFIKAAALYRAASPEIEFSLIHSGQHFDHNLSRIFFEEMSLPEPDYFLGVGGYSHGKMTGIMLEKIEEIMMNDRPDWAIVFGDTNTTLAGALAASKLHIPLAHVEAGLRSFNREMPEEINRILTDHCANLLFTPNTQSSDQLKKEGMASDKVKVVGDVMFDTFMHYASEATERSQVLDKHQLQQETYVLATFHRQENTDDKTKLQQLIKGFTEVSKIHPVIIPLHPRTRKKLSEYGLMEEATQHLRLIDPVGYLDMIELEKNAKAIFTDSGGVQKEAFYANRPCFILRNETEWVELVEYGNHQLIGTDSTKIAHALSQTHNTNNSTPPNLYGDGKAAEKILDALCVATT